MNVRETAIPGALILEPKVWADTRGFLLEMYRANRYAELGVGGLLVQDNLSFSGKGVLRGLHWQQPHAQGKLVQVVAGEVFDVAVDLRRGSPAFGQWVGAVLSGDNRRQFWLPPGVAHGFLVTGPSALLVYKCSDYYDPQAECTVRWDDADLAIDWPLAGPPELSDKDRNAPCLSDIPPDKLPA
ncbi:MAG: dTDP-4-dehydrorhamnose 3,5-epimerase [Thermoguttaceae bacterium]